MTPRDAQFLAAGMVLSPLLALLGLALLRVLRSGRQDSLSSVHRYFHNRDNP